VSEDIWSVLPDPPNRATRGVAHQNKLFLFYFKQPGVNFTNILRAAFPTKYIFTAFFLLT